MSPIALRAKKCLALLQHLVGLLQQSDQQPLGISEAEAVDALGRYRIWAGNIGAFQRLEVQSSLDYRVRDAPKIANQITELLDELTESLDDACSIASSARENRTGLLLDAGTNLGGSVRNGDDGDHENDSDDKELSEIREIFESIQDGINNLFRFSIIIRNNTNRDRYTKAAAAAIANPFNDEFDIFHVEHKFPALRVKNDRWLIERLGKAITQRRQYLRYCREHRDKTAKEPESSEHGQMALRSAELIHEMPARLMPSARSDFSKPTSTLAPTQASTLVLKSGQVIEEEAEQTLSQTSYATSIDEESSNVTLSVIKLEDVSKGLGQFECPYCWQIQTCRNQKAWKKHVLSDLKPYVCTFEDCQLKLFSDRDTWFSHELKDHRQEWRCYFCSHPFEKSENYQRHLSSRHPESFTKDQIPALLEMSQRGLAKLSPTNCPFCEDWEERLRKINPHIPTTEALAVTPSQFQHHLGAHMEQLALFAIPRGYTEEGEADSGNAAPQVESNASSLGSSIADSVIAQALRHCEDILNEIIEESHLKYTSTSLPAFSLWIPGRGRTTVPLLSFTKIAEKLESGEYRTADDLFVDMTLLLVILSIENDGTLQKGRHQLFLNLWAEKIGLTQENRELSIKLHNEIMWKLWRSSNISSDLEDSPEAIKLTISMLDGERITRRFRNRSSLEEVYTFVECHGLINGVPPLNVADRLPEQYEHEYRFVLQLAGNPEPSGGCYLSANRTVGEVFEQSFADLIVLDLGIDDPPQMVREISRRGVDEGLKVLHEVSLETENSEASDFSTFDNNSNRGSTFISGHGPRATSPHHESLVGEAVGASRSPTNAAINNLDEDSETVKLGNMIRLSSLNVNTVGLPSKPVYGIGQSMAESSKFLSTDSDFSWEDESALKKRSSKDTDSLQNESDSGLVTFEGASEIGSSARRIIRKTKGERTSLIFDDPPPQSKAAPSKSEPRSPALSIDSPLSDFKINDGRLHDASRLLHCDLMLALIESGHDVNFASTKHEGRTPLAELCLRAMDSYPSFDQVDKAAKLLIANGADIRRVSSSGKTIVHFALDSREPLEILEILGGTLWNVINEGAFLFRDSRYTYSLTKYVEKDLFLGPSHQKENILRILRRYGAKDRFWAHHYPFDGYQPDDSCGAPPYIETEIRLRKAREARVHDTLADQWTTERVIDFLVANGFSDSWQRTFKALEISGSDFLDLGSGHGGRGTFGMMHEKIYPYLAQECRTSETGWDQEKEREEGKRVRRLIRAIVRNEVQGDPSAPVLSPTRPASDFTIALYDFNGEVENEGAMKRGDSIAIVQRGSTGWWLIQSSEGQRWVPSKYLADPDYFQQQFKAAREDIYIQQRLHVAASYASGVLPEDIDRQLLHQCHSNALEVTRQKFLARFPDPNTHMGLLAETLESSNRPTNITGYADSGTQPVNKRERGPPPTTRGFDKIERRRDKETQLSLEIITHDGRVIDPSDQLPQFDSGLGDYEDRKIHESRERSASTSKPRIRTGPGISPASLAGPPVSGMHEYREAKGDHEVEVAEGSIRVTKSDEVVDIKGKARENPARVEQPPDPKLGVAGRLSKIFKRRPKSGIPSENTISYQANFNQQKTKKWAEAKPMDYGNDDWGDEGDDNILPTPISKSPSPGLPPGSKIKSPGADLSDGRVSRPPNPKHSVLDKVRRHSQNTISNSIGDQTRSSQAGSHSAGISGLPSTSTLEAFGARDVVYCHQCEHEWYRDQYGTTCPRCDSEITEIVEPVSRPQSVGAPSSVLLLYMSELSSQRACNGCDGLISVGQYYSQYTCGHSFHRDNCDKGGCLVCGSGQSVQTKSQAKADPKDNLTVLREALHKEMRIKLGSENMLEALMTKKAKQTKEQRQMVMAELDNSNERIRDLTRKITKLSMLPKTPSEGVDQQPPFKPDDDDDDDWDRRWKGVDRYVS